MKDIILVCEDLLGLEVYSILDWINQWHRLKRKEIPYHVLGFISDEEAPFGSLCPGLPRLGAIQGWSPRGEEWYVMGIKTPAGKKCAAELLRQAGCRFETVYPPWLIPIPTPLGEGSVISAYTIHPDARFGRFVTVIGAMIADYPVGDYSTVLRFSNVIGPVGTETFVGSHVFSRMGRTIGDHCHLSDGSVVVNHVKPGTSVAGVPARKINR